jgi:hypothetical protein
MQAETIERTISARWALFAVLLSASIGRLSTLNEPFTRNHESSASGPMVCAARNMVRYGFFTCHFGYVENCDWVDPTQFTFYNHHPPLVPILLAISAKLFGDVPWAYRLPGAISSVLTSGLLYLMLARKFDWRVGFSTALLYSFIPFTWMFGDMPDVVGPNLLLFGLLTIECYSRWSDNGAREWIYWAIASWLLCALCDWPAFFLVPVLSAHFVLTRPRQVWLHIVPFAFFAGLVLVAQLGWLTKGGDTSVISQFFHRIDGPSDLGVKIGFAEWWKVSIENYVYHTFTLPVIAACLIYLVSLVQIARQNYKALSVHDTTLMMLSWGLVHVLIGFQSSYQHMWVWCVLVPGACAAAVLGSRALWLALPPTVRFSPVTPYLTGTLAVAFLVSSYLEAKHLNDAGLDIKRISYTDADFGSVIRQTVPSGQGVLTSDAGDPVVRYCEPALWFYSDRQLRTGIRTVDQLDSSLAAGDYGLFYGFVQHGGPAPSWFIMPSEHHETYKELAAVLDARYARWEKDGFLIYYLPMSPSDAAKVQTDAAKVQTAASR